MPIVSQKITGNFNKMLKGGLLALGVLLLLGLLACSDKKPEASKARKERVVPVTVTTVEEKTVPVQLTAIGNVEAYSTVAVKSRITGELNQVHFKEGQDVIHGAVVPAACCSRCMTGHRGSVSTGGRLGRPAGP